MRKLVIVLLCIFLAWFSYYSVVSGFNIGENFSVNNYKNVSAASREIDTLVSQLVNINDVQFEEKKNSLESEIKKYKNTKEEYDELVGTVETEDETVPEISLVDIYDVDFLWTAIGNYGTEEGIKLKFDVARSTTSMLDSQNYIMCDLKFTVSGDYIPITDFIYDLEDDSKLGFEISDFSLSKGGENLQATFTVKNVPINSKNLTEITTSITPESIDENGNTVNTNQNTATTTNTNTTTTSSTSNTVANTNTVNP